MSALFDIFGNKYMRLIGKSLLKKFLGILLQLHYGVRAVVPGLI